MLHEEGDRVKALHGRLLLSEVIAQNKALADHKRRVVAARGAQEAAFVQQQRAALEVRICGGGVVQGSRCMTLRISCEGALQGVGRGSGCACMRLPAVCWPWAGQGRQLHAALLRATPITPHI